MTKPLISIIIVAYNSGEYLKNTLRSCLKQTYKNTEILILDNNSSEDIRESIINLGDYKLMEEKEDRDSSIFMLSQITNLGESRSIRLYRSEKNLGPYNGLNYLLEKAQGEYIATQDHDDIWHSEKLEKQIQFLEENPTYIGCGTKTIMYYEGDKKYFEYFLGEKNYYTIHPSLLFRYDGGFRYDTMETEYMCDAWSIKVNLSRGENKIYNLDESLTLHLIKKGSTNYSYKWHILTWTHLKRAYMLHPPLYATLTIIWEIFRKLLYPVLHILGFGSWIDRIERVPFRILGNTIKTIEGDEWWRDYL